MYYTMSNDLSIFDFTIFHDIYCRFYANAFINDCSKVCPELSGVFHFSFTNLYSRSVSEEERSFALGMQFVIFRLFGYIPAPIVFGNLIDSTCILWQSTCGEKGGRCLIYDIESFRYKYVILNSCYGRFIIKISS